ncbi:MAG: FAD-dependent oxidoreductase [Thermodesulfobacteriota bacterium]
MEEHLPPAFDCIILGAGPAGLCASVYAARKMMATLLLGKVLGGQVATYYDVENYLGFSVIEASDLIARFREHVDRFGLFRKTGISITAANLDGPVKSIVTDEGETFRARTLIIATGKRPRTLDIPGEARLTGRGVAFCSTCDAPLYRDADVAVLGGGNSALEAAADLCKVARSVKLFSIGPLTADPFLAESVGRNEKLVVFPRHRALEILGEQSVTGLVVKSLDTGIEASVAVEGVFVEIGLTPNSELFAGKLALNPKKEIIVDLACRTSAPGVFACGDVTSVPYKQIVTAVGDGAKAALSAYHHILGVPPDH